MVNFQEFKQNQALNILCIDNDFEFTRKILKVFEVDKGENHISVVNSGLDALDYILYLGKFRDKTYPLPNIILLDPNLPDINGFSLLSEIKQNIKLLTIPVIMLSPSFSRDEVKRGYTLGAVSCIHKPVEDDLNEFVGALSNYWSRLVQLPNKEDPVEVNNTLHKNGVMRIQEAILGIGKSNI